MHASSHYKRWNQHGTSSGDDDFCNNLPETCLLVISSYQMAVELHIITYQKLRPGDISLVHSICHIGCSTWFLWDLFTLAVKTNRINMQQRASDWRYDEALSLVCSSSCIEARNIIPDERVSVVVCRIHRLLHGALS